MSNVTELDTRLMGIGQVIESSRHAVPTYQRSYAWKESHVEDLFSDVATAIYDKEDEYFLGSIVLTGAESNEPEVVDGQQRIATTIVLIAAIRDYLLENGHEAKAEEIGRKFLATRNLRTDDLVPQLKLNSVDNDYFADRVICAIPDRTGRQPVLESHRRINKAAEIAEARVAVIVKSAGTRAVDSLIDWIEFIQKKMKVIRVSVPSHANAFTIFETLNDRGLALAISDLMKNFLFSRAADRLPEVQANWIAMGSILESVGGDEIVVDYIRHLWSSKHGLVRERQLYKELRKRITTKTHAVNFTTDLDECAKIYCALFNSGHPFWSRYGDVARGYIADMNILQVREIRPLLLAIIRKFPIQKAIKALRLLVSCAVRSLVVTGRGGIMESTYATIAMDISNEKVTNEKQLRDALRTSIPADQEFEEAFAIASSSNSQRARYFLREIERYINSEEPEWVPSGSVDEVSLEHVLPRVLTDEWTEFDDDSHRSSVHRLGNQAILASGDNSRLGNVGFDEKKKVFKRSGFKMTSLIAQRSKWSVSEIASRQATLAKLAVGTWPLSGDSRQAMKPEKLRAVLGVQKKVKKVLRSKK